MGFRVKRYGPEVTSTVLGLNGNRLVRLRKNQAKLHRPRIAEIPAQMRDKPLLNPDGSAINGKNRSRIKAIPNTPA